MQSLHRRKLSCLPDPGQETADPRAGKAEGDVDKTERFGGGKALERHGDFYKIRAQYIGF